MQGVCSDFRVMGKGNVTADVQKFAALSQRRRAKNVLVCKNIIRSV